MENEDQTSDALPVIEEEKTIALRKPIGLGGITYDKFDLREPTAGELSRASKAGGSLDVAIALISIIAKVPKSVVEKITQRDLEEAAGYLGGFTLDGPATGATSLQN
jgi:hypothetical protein